MLGITVIATAIILNLKTGRNIFSLSSCWEMWSSQDFSLVSQWIVTNAHLQIIILLFLFLFFSHTNEHDCTHTHTLKTDAHTTPTDLLNRAVTVKLCEFLSCHSAPHSCGTRGDENLKDTVEPGVHTHKHTPTHAHAQAHTHTYKPAPTHSIGI